MSKTVGDRFFDDLEQKLAEAKSQRIEVKDVRDVPDYMRDSVSNTLLTGGKVFWDPVNEIYIMQDGKQHFPQTGKA